MEPAGTCGACAKEVEASLGGVDQAIPCGARAGASRPANARPSPSVERDWQVAPAGGRFFPGLTATSVVEALNAEPAARASGEPIGTRACANIVAAVSHENSMNGQGRPARVKCVLSSRGRVDRNLARHTSR